MLSNIGTNTHTQIDTHIANNTGINTGDQDITGIATNTTNITANAAQILLLDTAIGVIETEQATQNTAIDLNTAKASESTTVSDTAELDLTLTGTDITADLVASSIDETKLDASVNTSLDLADTALQSFTESDPTFTVSQAANIDATDIANLGNLSGTNSGDIVLAGAYDYITISNQTITRNQINLSTDVTWGAASVPTANILAAAVTQHESALTITESQISDLTHTIDTNLTETEVDAFVANNGYSIGSHTVDTNTQLSDAEVATAAINEGFVTGPHTIETNNLGTAVTWANVPDSNITESSVTQHEGAITHQNLSGAGTNTHAQIDAFITAGNAALTTINTNATNNTGTVTIHNDVSNAGSGQIISDAERIAIGNNSAKTGITAQQAADITVNNAKISYSDAATVAANSAQILLNDTAIGSIATDQTTQNTAIGLNTAKETNVTTNLSVGTVTATTLDVNSSDGTNATLPAATTDDAGLLTADKFDEIELNTTNYAALLGALTGNISPRIDLNQTNITTNESNISTNASDISDLLELVKTKAVGFSPETIQYNSNTIADDGSFTGDVLDLDLTSMAATATFSPGVDKINCLVAGMYVINVNLHYTANANNTNNNRVNLQIRTLIDDVATGPIGSSGYIRAREGHNDSSLHISGYIVTLTANQTISFGLNHDAQRDEEVNILGDSSYISIRKLID